MDLLTQLNNAMNYIEENLCNDLALSDISKVTTYSSYHFGRLFYYIAEMPLSEYIRKRKLTLAAIELQNNNVKVIDLAVKYGYDSADSFTRAFIKQHGVTPTSARQTGVTLKIFSPLIFQIKIKGVQEMNWRIEQKDAFEIFGIERIFPNEDVGKIPDFWRECQENGSYEKLFDDACGIRGKKGECVINAICGHIEPHSNEFPYMLFAVKKAGCKTTGYKFARIPKQNWAVFRVDDLRDHADCQIPKLFKRVYMYIFYIKFSSVTLGAFYFVKNKRPLGIRKVICIAIKLMK
jgi:AraC-type DNA-binding domain-containing proteins